MCLSPASGKLQYSLRIFRFPLGEALLFFFQILLTWFCFPLSVLSEEIS